MDGMLIYCRLLFAITTGVAALHVKNNRNETTMKHDPAGEAHI